MEFDLKRNSIESLICLSQQLKKLKKTGDVAHRRGNGRSKKIVSDKSRELEQYIREDSSLSLRTLATKLSGDEVEVSHVTVGARLRELGYKSGLPNGTPMLTADQRQTELHGPQIT